MIVFIVCFFSHVNFVCFIGDGFSNYENFTSPDERGRYEWNETSNFIMPQRLNCVYGSQNKDMEGFAERTCEGNLNWGEYDGKQCVTINTFRLRNVTNVSNALSSDSWYIHTWYTTGKCD